MNLLLTPAVLYIRDVAGTAGQEHVEAWRPALRGVREIFHARFVTHRYPPHHHETWAVIVIDGGGIRYDLEHHHRGGDSTTVTILPPHVVHDGRAATGSGFSKRVAYLDTTILPASLAGRSVDRSEIADPELRAALSRLHHTLRGHDDALDGEERLASIARRLRFHLGERSFPCQPAEHHQAGQLREYLTAHAYETVTLEQASTALGHSVGHLSRSFRATFAISPHAFVIALRVEQARRLLLDGCAPAEAAALTGFCDQAHLHRHFYRHTGTTPGRYGRHGPRS